ncbi:hypothetical protein, partial [Thalassospira profundimaris]|uniref:hypothetical protein n=1 Tax=Thalassospira profundimaris TaxID=502049 RepID=UPI001C68A080
LPAYLQCQRTHPEGKYIPKDKPTRPQSTARRSTAPRRWRRVIGLLALLVNTFLSKNRKKVACAKILRLAAFRGYEMPLNDDKFGKITGLPTSHSRQQSMAIAADKRIPAVFTKQGRKTEQTPCGPHCCRDRVP